MNKSIQTMKQTLQINIEVQSQDDKQVSSPTGLEAINKAFIVDHVGKVAHIENVQRLKHFKRMCKTVKYKNKDLDWRI